MTTSYEKAVRLLTKATESPITIGFEGITTRQMNEAIRTLLAGPPEREGWVLEARFLLDRLEDFERDLMDNGAAREFFGHVSPAAARLRALLSAAPKP